VARLALGLRLNVHLFPDMGSAVWSRPAKKALGGTNGSGSEIAEHSPSTTNIPCKLKLFAPRERPLRLAEPNLRPRVSIRRGEMIYTL
jgi:hypothetical protein